MFESLAPLGGTDQFPCFFHGSRQIRSLPLAPFLLRPLDLLPGGTLSARSGIFSSAEDVRMPPDHFLRDRARHIVQRKQAFFLRHAGVKHHLKEQIPKFFPQVLGVPCLCQNIDPADHLRRFFYALRFEALMGLDAVPRAFHPQLLHDLFQSFNLAHLFPRFASLERPALFSILISG